MKEKLKKIFLNKNFWAVFFEIICAALIFVCGYFSGLANGLTIDNSIRDKLVETTLDDSKINKKRRNLNDFEFVSIPYGGNIETEIIVDLGFIVQNMIEYKEDLYAYVQANMPYQTYTFPLFMTLDLFDSANNYYNAHIYSITRYSTSVALRVENRRCTIGTLPNGDNFLRSYTSYTSDNIFSIKEDMTLSYSSYFDFAVSSVYTNTFYDTLIVYNSSTAGKGTTYTFGTYNLQLFDICNIGAYTFPSSSSSQEELEQAYQNGFDKGKSEGKTEGYNEGKTEGYNEGYQAGLENSFTEDDIYNSYLNGFDKGKSEGRIEGYNEGLQVGKEIGYQNRIDSVEDTEQKINSVWTILENAITSVLNVLSFEILPGIPLYICIGVPVFLAVLLWFIKMGQS